MNTSTWIETAIKKREDELQRLYRYQNELKDGPVASKRKGIGASAALSKDNDETHKKRQSLRSLLGLH